MRVLRRDGSVCEVDEDQILYFTTFQKVITVHTREEEYVVPTTFEHVQRAFEDLGFAKIDRSYLVRLGKIDSYDEERRVVRFGGKTEKNVPVSEPNIGKVISYLARKQSEEE